MKSNLEWKFAGSGSVRGLVLAISAGLIAGVTPIAGIAQTDGAKSGGGLGDMLRPATPLDPTEALIEQTIAVREKFGFNADKEFVRELLTDPERFNALVGRVTGGHYATPAEIEELANRLRVQDEAIEIMRRLRDDPNFAGVYVDQQGTMRLGFTGGTEGLASQRLIETQDDPETAARMQAFAATRSLGDLESLRDRVIDAIPDLRRAGIQISEVAVDIRDNTVRVGVADLDPKIREVLAERFEGLEIFEQPISVPDDRFDTSNPMRAGVAITGCTSAWKARDRTNSQLVMLTAGHCAPGTSGTTNGPGAGFNQGTNPNGTTRLVGTVDQTTWLFPNTGPTGNRTGSGPADALRVPFQVGSLPWLYAYDSANSGGFTDGEEAPVSGVDGTVVIGTSICSAGRNSPGNQIGGANWKNCGTVSQVNTARVFSRSAGSPDRFTILNANAADHISIPGDSGAPIWRIAWNGSEFEAIAVGINTGGPTGSEVFSDIERVEDALNVDIVHF